MTLVEQLLKSAKIDAESTTAKAAKRLAATLKAGGISEATQTTILKSLMGGVSTDSVSSVEATQEKAQKPTTTDILKTKYKHVDIDSTSTAAILKATYFQDNSPGDFVAEYGMEAVDLLVAKYMTPERLAASQASDTSSLLAAKYARFNK
ncbi:hypothetical protein GIV66_30310 [Pseudomonas sp. PA-3-11C]|nr:MULTISPECIES: hypothetical protein [unclassified Pseudomonas]MCF5512072.1 hypothetical protein [Pseudomonas sp. PA-3-6H]MCF5561492.1 hypothetical protein [Pseudomonas sp. PA-3-5D]MCF5571069.1 hypothetical protein [Pseudomonas sp. PA-3-11C]MCF5595397.1 hypothetical protein [Pseudomonas sp. PA-3-10C]